MAFIIHGLMHDVIDYKKLIESQASQPAFEPRRVVGAKRKYYNSKTHTKAAVKKISYHNGIVKK